MEKRTIRFVVLFMMFLLVVMVEPMIASGTWKVNIVPAALNKDNVIRLVSGYTQPIYLMLQASKGIKGSAADHCVEIELDLPKGVKVLHTDGRYELLGRFSDKDGDREKERFKFRVADNLIAEIGQTLGEWQIHCFYLDIPESIVAGESYLITTLRYDDDLFKESWPIQLYELEQTGIQFQDIRIGLWDYGFSYYSGEVAEEIGHFLAACGVNYIETQKPETYPGLSKSGIIFGGYVHHGAFANSDHPDIDVKGNKILNSYADAQAVIDSNGAVIQRGIDELVKVARAYDGLCLIDFEPSATTGFSPNSIAKFKELYKVSDADFQELHDFMREYGVHSYNVEEPMLKDLYQKWVSFRTWQVSEYVRIISEGVKAQYPEARFEVTPNNTYGDDGLHTLARGYNAAAMSPHLYGIQPQIYKGYGATATKSAIIEVSNFRKHAQCKLYPILLIRYAGASVKNTPERVRQQIVGSLAEGADGVILYFAHYMDAPYWVMLASLTNELENIKRFYEEGIRCDELFIPKKMPLGSDQIACYPGYSVEVENPQWHYTVHRVDDTYCLTLFNFNEGNDLEFKFDNINSNYVVLNVNGAETYGAGGETVFLVSPQDIAFIILKDK